MTIILHVIRKHDYTDQHATLDSFFSAVHIKEGHEPLIQSKLAPHVVEIVDFVHQYAQNIVYIHMIDVQSDSSVMTRPSHRARHPPKCLVNHIWYFMT